MTTLYQPNLSYYQDVFGEPHVKRQ